MTREELINNILLNQERTGDVIWNRHRLEQFCTAELEVISEASNHMIRK